MLKRLRQVFHALYVIDGFYIDCFGTINVNEYITVLLTAGGGLVPEGVDHEDVFARLKHNFIIEQGERECLAKSCDDIFAVLRH